MRPKAWLAAVAAVLLALAFGLYVLHYAIFHDLDHLLIYGLGDLAFLPIEVLLVVIVVERVLARHEKRLMLDKMNMLIGMFFNELGVRLLGELTGGIENKEELRPYLSIDASWDAARYRAALAFAESFECRADASKLELPHLRDMLAEQRDLLVSLLGNPNLLEHEQFTDLLWAIFHLADELRARPSLEGLPRSDLEHLSGDVRRAYRHLTAEWLRYCRHLQRAYPYIFSILVRTHPLQEHPDATVR